MGTILSDIEQGVVVCRYCELGEHDVVAGPGVGVCVCPCHGHVNQQAEQIASIRKLLEGDRERVSDRREDVTSWLSNATDDVSSLIRQLGRAHADACEFEPVTAMVILPLMAAAREIEAKLAELTSVRGQK
jgi:hypothetical protein